MGKGRAGTYLRGKGSHWPGPDIFVPPRKTNFQADTEGELQVLQKYRKIRSVSLQPVSFVPKALIPWFVISKSESGGLKHTLIRDYRVFNKHLIPHQFNLDRIKEVFPFFKMGMWAAKVEPKHALSSFGIRLKEGILRFHSGGTT